MFSNIDAAREGGSAATLRHLLQRHQHFVRYLAIGATACLIDLVLFMALYNLAGTSILFAHSVSVPTAVLFSFFVNARHNFRTHDYMAARLVSFVLVCTVGYGVGYLVTAAVASGPFDANVGKLVSLPVVFVTQYLLNSRITFRKVQA